MIRDNWRIVEKSLYSHQKLRSVSQTQFPASNSICDLGINSQRGDYFIGIHTPEVFTYCHSTIALFCYRVIIIQHCTSSCVNAIHPITAGMRNYQSVSSDAHCFSYHSINICRHYCSNQLFAFEVEELFDFLPLRSLDLLFRLGVAS